MSKESGVPAAPTRRIPRLVVAGLALLALGGLTGCGASQRDATSYKDTEDNFLQGCETLAEQDSADIASGDAKGKDLTEISDPKTYCQCVFDAISKDVPFKEFKEINSTLRDEGGPLPDSFVKAYDGCKPDDSGK